MSFTKYETRGAYHWKELANRSPESYSARLHAQYDWFVEQARNRQPKLIVDVGCGDAALTHLLSEATGARVVGIEPEPRGIELAEQALSEAGSRAQVRHGRGEELPFGDGEVSLVVMSEVVEHVESAERLVAEAARVLEPSGTLLVSTPQWQRPDLREHHVREYRGDELAEVCRPFFEEVEVLVAEPPGLYDRYLSARWIALAVNLVSLAGWNPFGLRLPATPRRARWRELFAVAARPRHAS
ncbi:MAG: class I SAM-dependent methyltransferase [Actinomycetota bacterium]|nr:class I SAM-dependent methyltransferase [Actinomycetota bacterium]